MTLDVGKLLQPISDGEPCGPNLEYDALFGEMERAAQGRAEQRFGESVLAAEPPNWRDMQRMAKELLTRTKDLRVLMYLARAGCIPRVSPVWPQPLKPSAVS